MIPDHLISISIAPHVMSLARLGEIFQWNKQIKLISKRNKSCRRHIRRAEITGKRGWIETPDKHFQNVHNYGK